jgi:hypothetical protein
MSILSDDFISHNLRFAIRNRSTVLTQIRPTVTTTVTIEASKQNIDATFEVLTDGREEQVDTMFIVDQSDLDPLPKKGFVYSDESGRQYKVQSTRTDYARIGLTLMCSAKDQR